MQSLTTLGSSITKDDATYVEELLRKVFAVLPSDKGINPHDLLDSYMIALRGLDKNGLRQTVLKIIAGTLDDKLRFVPRPPELANYVRQETRTIHQLSRPVSSAPVETVPSLEKMRARWAGVPILHENIEMDKAMSMAKKGEVPKGAVYVALLGNFYMPPPGFYGEPRVAKARPQADEPDFEIPDRDPDYWRTIDGLKDAPALTDQNIKFRGKVHAAIAPVSADVATEIENETQNDD